jgi:hypothetical protein
MDTSEKIWWGVLAFIFITCILLVADGLIFVGTGNQYHVGKIVSVGHKPSNTGVGVGTAIGVGGTGNVGVGTVVIHSDDEFNLWVDVNGDVYKVKTDKNKYFKLKIGDKIKFWEYRGRILKIRWGYIY